jgi:hypothetical protein
MTELVHIAIPQFVPAPNTFVDRFLQLPDAPDQTIYTVYARANPDGTGPRRVGFALTEHATEWCTRGVRWRFHDDQSEYSLFLRFVLLDGIEELVYPLRTALRHPWLSARVPPTPDGPAVQLGCAPPVKQQTTRYHFRARLARGEYVDPIIIVTPINGTGDGDDDAARGPGLAALDDGAPGALVDPPVELVLPLGEGDAFTVDVKISTDGPMFSLPPTPIDPDPDQVPGGVQWSASKQFPAATLTFQFPIDEISRLQSKSPGLIFSLVAIRNGQGFQTCLLTAPTEPVTETFHFDVFTAGGTVAHGVYDPIIIVTPING